MTRYQFERATKGKFHHKAVFTLSDGTTVEGYMQPFDDTYVYTTDLDGTAGKRIALADIKNISFPDN